jgi:hypothetical protein
MQLESNERVDPQADRLLVKDMTLLALLPLEARSAGKTLA